MSSRLSTPASGPGIPLQIANLITLTEAARLAGVNPASLRHAIRQQRLSAIKPGRDWMVERAEIERYIRERKSWKTHNSTAQR